MKSGNMHIISYRDINAIYHIVILDNIRSVTIHVQSPDFVFTVYDYDKAVQLSDKIKQEILRIFDKRIAKSKLKLL
jgi:hypothetical protein